MIEHEFNPGDVYWDNCNSCKTPNLHTYLGLQPSFKEIEGYHLGNCGQCGTTRKVNLELRLE